MPHSLFRNTRSNVSPPVWRTPTLDGKLYDLKGVKRVAQEMRALGVKLVMVERQQASYLRKGPGMEKRANQQVRNSFQVGYGYAIVEMDRFGDNVYLTPLEEQLGAKTHQKISLPVMIDYEEWRRWREE